MKRILVCVMTLVMLFACAALAAEENWEYDAEYYFMRGYTGEEALVEMPAWVDNCPVEVLCDGVLLGKAATEKLILPETLLDLRQSNICDMPLLTQVQLPDSLIIIGNSNFSYCSALEEVVIPGSVSYIGSGCLRMCDNLSSVVFEGVCPVFGPDCLDYNAPDLVITVPEDQLDAYRAALPEGLNIVSSGKPAQVYAFTSDEYYYTVYEDGTVAGYAGYETRVDIPQTMYDVPVTAIGDYAFPSSYYISYITVPEGVASVGEYAFSDMNQLVYVDLPSTLKSIGKCAFENFRGYSIVLPEGLEEIGEKAFRNAWIRGELVLPSTLKRISADFMEECSMIERLVVKCDPMILPEGLADMYPNVEIAAAEDATETQVKRLNAYLYGAPALEITAQPESVTVADGMQARVEVEAQGDDLVYTWYYRDAADKHFSVSEKCTGSYYEATMNESSNGRCVYCVVSDVYGNSVESDMAQLMMGAALEIISQPESVCVQEGDEAVVTVEAAGDGLTYAWYYKNALGEEFVRSEECTGNAYTAVMNADRDGSEVYCVVTDAYGHSVQTDAAVLTMEAAVVWEETENDPVQLELPVPTAEEAAPYAGMWKAETLTENGETYNAADFFMVMKMELYEDGSGRFAQDEFSEYMPIQWYVENGQAYAGDADGMFAITAGEGALEMTMDTITVRFVPDDGVSGEELTDEEALELFLQMLAEMEAQGELDGDWSAGYASPEDRLEKKFVCTGFTAGGVYQEDETYLGGEYSVLFHENGTVDFVMAGVPLPGSTWALQQVTVGLEEKDAFVITYYTMTYNCILTDAGFDLDYFGTVMHLEEEF